ncbi:copper homeostasis protein CutC [Shigella flexneri]
MTFAQHQRRGLNALAGRLAFCAPAHSIPVNPIIRPRGGDFFYTEGEYAEIWMICDGRALGYQGW